MSDDTHGIWEQQYPDGNASDDCHCESDTGTQPSLYQTFWRDTRAELHRREYAKGLATLGGLTATSSLLAPLAGLSRAFETGYSGPVYEDGIALVDDNGDRVTESRLGAGEQLTVFPEPRPGIKNAPTLLVRFSEDEYGGDTKPEFTVGGYAAFSKVCTHAGCMVSNRDGDTLVCPCHSGLFDPLSGATVVGGPPPRALPQLPITVASDGHLIATGNFEGAVGPGGD